MSVLEFDGHELPETLCQVIRSASLKDIGLYKGDDHSFLTPILDPKENDMRKIKAEYKKYTSLQDLNFNAVVNHVNRSTTVDPIVQSVQSIHVGIGDKTALKKLQHIELLEDVSDSVTHLLYLGSNRFLVLRTSRSTILAGDILQANSLPINVGEQELFTIFRNGKEFVPEKYASYNTSFQTKKIVQIKLYSSPEIYKIIDSDGQDCYGGALLSNKLSEKKLLDLIKAINKVLEGVKGVLPNRDHFPEYLDLLTFAKGCGIDCYTLNLLIECCECLRFDKTKYDVCDEDWYYILTPEQEEELKKKKKAELTTKYKSTRAKFDAKLKEIKTRRVMIFFKAAGRVNDLTYINSLEEELDDIAKQAKALDVLGLIGVGEAKDMRKKAIENSKPKPGENWITAAKLVAFIAAVSTIGWVWFTSKNNMEIFDYKLAAADEILAQGKYVEARDAYRLAYEEYRPKVTAMFAQSKMNKRVKMLEEALNTEIEDGISQISAMRIADGGKFSKVAEDLMFRLLELAPNDSRLLELKEVWKNQ